ncbi:MAG: hypothetical protein HPY50_07565 [Firmicutes bacterium]|nr:hypothetical protein [Bacillota bacterium]
MKTPGTALMAGSLIVYSLTHGLVDAACAALVFTIPRLYQLDGQWFFTLVILYNILAFGLQSPLGMLVDHLRQPRGSALAGCLVTAAAIPGLYLSPWLAVCLAGVGNALFHLGGGIVSLRLQPGRASLPGVFVAPGAVGLLAGTLVGKSGLVGPWLFPTLLVFAALVIYRLDTPSIDYQDCRTASVDRFGLVLLLVLTAVVSRSFIGAVLVFPWKESTYLLVGLTLAVALGKGLGGLLADRFGWIRVSITGLALSAPLVALCSDRPYLAIPGVLLFNLTMPVTLTAAANTLPGHPGFAFGLTTLALLVGALPQFFGFGTGLGRPTVFSLILLSALVLLVGLRLYDNGSQTALPSRRLEAVESS